MRNPNVTRLIVATAQRNKARKISIFVIRSDALALRESRMELRETRGCTQYDCASFVGLRVSMIEHIEDGDRNITLVTIERFAYDFGIILEKLLKGFDDATEVGRYGAIIDLRSLSKEKVFVSYETLRLF